MIKKRVSDETFKDEQWREEALKIHALISIEISKYLDQEWDRLYLKKEVCKRALNVIDELDQLLETMAPSFKQYQCLHQILFRLLKELQIESLIMEKIQKKFWTQYF
jgi:hypothetical protein